MKKVLSSLGTHVGKFLKAALVLFFLVSLTFTCLCSPVFQAFRLRGVKRESTSDNTSHWQVNILALESNFHPFNLTVMHDSTIFCSDLKSDCIWAFNSATGLRCIADGIRNPHSIAVDDFGVIWVSSRSERPNLIRKRGPFIYRITSDGNIEKVDLWKEKVDVVTDLAYDHSEKAVVLLDKFTRRISSLTPEGAIRTLSENASLSMLRVLGSVQAIAVGEEGALYLLDFGSVIVKMLPNGDKVLRGLDIRLSTLVSIKGDIAYHPSLGLLIADSANCKIWRMGDEHFEAIFSGGRKSKIKRPTGVAVGADGAIYICDPKVGAIASLKQKLTE